MNDVEEGNGLAKLVGDALIFLEELRGRLPAMLRDHKKSDAAFRNQSYRRWKAGLDKLKMFIVMSQELGSSFNERARAHAVTEHNYKFEAIVALHARSLRVSNEIQVLLREGFPDGALSRWRTLHELGAVEVHREFMTAAARWMAAEKLVSVLSARMAIRLNSFSLQKKFSMRCRHL